MGSHVLSYNNAVVMGCLAEPLKVRLMGQGMVSITWLFHAVSVDFERLHRTEILTDTPDVYAAE